MINSNQDMSRMQQDAIRRVREMHARAKRSIEGNPKTNQNKNSNDGTPLKSDSNKSLEDKYSVPEKNKPAPANKDLKKEKHKNSNPLKIFDVFLKDEEKSLILILLILLMGEEDNIGIMLALLYLLL